MKKLISTDKAPRPGLVPHAEEAALSDHRSVDRDPGGVRVGFALKHRLLKDRGVVEHKPHALGEALDLRMSFTHELHR